MCIEEQYVIEETFSKNGLLNILLNELTDEIFYTYKSDIIVKLSEYMHKDYWESKNDIITAICMQDITYTEIANEIILLSMKYQETTIQNVATELGNLFDIEDVFTKVQIGSDLLDVCSDIIYELNATANGINFSSFIELDNTTRNIISLHMYLPPMVIKPMKINNNYQSGYLTRNDSVILGGKESDHNMPVRLDVINILNQIPFVLDKEVMDTELEEPKEKLVGQDLENWKQYKIEKKALMRIYKDKTFWFNHRLDSRQRIYSQGYHLQYQGSEYNKALISLAKFEVVE